MCVFLLLIEVASLVPHCVCLDSLWIVQTNHLLYYIFENKIYSPVFVAYLQMLKSDL